MSAAEDAEVEKVGGTDDLDLLTVIEVREYAAKLLGLQRIPVTDIALVRLLVRALEAEHSIRLGGAWRKIDDRNDLTLLLPRAQPIRPG